VKGWLGQGVFGQKPSNPATRFATDNFAVMVTIEAPEAIPAGHTMPYRIVDREGHLVCPCDAPISSDGQSNLFWTGFYLAGRAWARNGGDFRLQVFFDAIPEPLLDLPFTVVPMNRYALLVGIEDYPNDKEDLPGIGLAVERMRTLLVEGFGFPQDHVTVVRDLEATRERIETELKALSERAGPDDAALFYYTAHGCQVLDFDGDEEDGWDEALVPADPRPELIASDEQMKVFLTDDRLSELFRGFRTKNLTVVFDSCHSGTANRDAAEVEPPPSAPLPFQRDIVFGKSLRDRAETARAAAKPRTSQDWDADAGHVFVSACRSFEVAKGLWNGGIFSNALVDALATANGESWDQIVARARAQVWNTVTTQSPTAGGATRRYPFSLAEASADAPFLRPSVAAEGAVDTSGEAVKFLPEGAAGSHLALVAGYSSLYVEQMGAAFDVYPAGQGALAGAPKGRVVLTGRTVAHAGTPISTGTIESGTVNEGDRLVPRTVRVPSGRPSVATNFTDPQDDAVRKRYVALLQSIPPLFQKDGRVRWLTEGNWADMDYVLEPRLFDGEVKLIVWNAGGQFVALFSGEDAAMAGRARDFILERHDRVTRVVRLQNTSPTFRLAARLVEPETEVPDRIAVEAHAGAPAWFYVFAAAGPDDIAFVGTTNRAVPAGEVYAVSIAMPKSPGQRRVPMPVKIVASSKPLDFGAVAKAGSGLRADAMIRAMRAAYGAGSDDFLLTEGWATETLWSNPR